MPYPVLTFTIPFYAGQSYLKKAIESVVRQTYASWELIVCDDAGPEPGIAELVASFADARMHYYRNEKNLGMAGNWNRCLDLARSDLVTILHADDQLLERYAALMLSAARDHPQSLAFFCQAKIIDEKGTPRFSFADFMKRFLVPAGGSFLLKGEPGLEALLRGNFVFCPALCYRKSVLGTRRFDEHLSFVPDLELVSRLLLEEESLVGLRKTAYAYRRHPQSATAKHTQDLSRFRQESRLYDLLRARSLARGWTDAAEIARKKLMIKLNLAYCLSMDHCRLHWTPARQKMQLLREMMSGTDS